MLYFLTVFHTLPFILLFVTWVSLWTLPKLYFFLFSNLTRSSYFELSRLRTIRKAVSVPIFQLNSLLLFPTEASENQLQSYICSYFHLHCPCICLLQD